MSVRVPSSRSALFRRVSSIALLGGLIAGCSSGFQRFDTSLYDEAVPRQTSQISNPYPGDVDTTTTASIPNRVVPAANVAPAGVPQGVYHKPEPTYAQPQPTYTPQSYEPYIAPQSQGQLQSGRQLLSRVNNVRQSALPAPAAPSFSAPSPDPVRQDVAQYTAPKPEVVVQPVPKTEIVTHDTDALKTDSVKTASVKTASPSVPEPVVATATQATTTKDGWSSAGATSITVDQGETLYNLSKRYGVPVEAIRNVNNMSRGSTLRHGQTIIIPNYVFNKTAAVSAPDNNPKTRAARASTGYIGEAQPGNAALPTKRPQAVAAVSPVIVGKEITRQTDVLSNSVSETGKELASGLVPKSRSIKTSNNSFYEVQSGDSLSRIAGRAGTTVSALQQANGLEGTSIRIGQKLKLPTGTDPVITASVPKIPTAGEAKTEENDVDPIVTGSLKPSTADDEAAAPARTGISNFRWPVKGRVVSTFGESGTNGANEGIDISVPEGTAVHAAENGVVIYVGDEISSYGKLVLIRHDDDWVSAYAHNRNYEVKKGDQVRRGQIIARSGRTGDAARPKLHFELRKNSTPVNPKKYLAG